MVWKFKKLGKFLAICFVLGWCATVCMVLFVIISLEDNLETQRHGSRQENNSFEEVMKEFPWEDYITAVNSRNTPETEKYSTELLLKLIPYLIQPPAVPENDSCNAPPIKIKSACRLLATPRKVGVLWQFGFDVDALEIHLKELNEIVDKFFILESIMTNSGFISSKPLLWDALKCSKRFAKLAHKVVHFVVDDADLADTNGSQMWSRETQQENIRWLKFWEWNNATKYFGDEDLLGFGDVDEVPSRNEVASLKFCEIPAESVDIGIWFPFDGINTVFQTDFPVSGHQYTLGDPTFWTLKSARNYYLNYRKTPSRMRGTSRNYMLGGMHLSRYAYPPFQLTKMLTASEADMNALKTVIEVGMLYAQNKRREAENVLNLVPKGFRRGRSNRILSVEEFRKMDGKEAKAILIMPGYLKCNLKRFPGFEKRHDSRLDEWSQHSK